MLKLWPMDDQWSGRCRLLTLVILSPWWKVTKSKHVFYSYHRNSRWSSVVLQEVGGRKDPQITSLLRIHRKDGKKRKKKSRDGKNRKREQRKRGEVEIGEWIHKYFFTTHFFFNLDSFLNTVIISTYITETWTDECDEVPNP